MGGTLVFRYVALLRKLRFVVLLLWIGGGIACAFFIFKFIDNLNQEFSAPSGTQAYDATGALARTFPSLSESVNFAIFVQGPPQSGRFDNLTSPAAVAASSYCASFESQLQASSFVGTNGLLKSVGCYYNLLSLGMPLTAQQLMNPDGQSMVIPIQVGVSFVSKQSEQIGKQIRDLSSDVAGNTANLTALGITAVTTGLPLYVSEIVEQVENDMAVMDAIVLPLAMLVMGVTVKSLRLLILPILSVGLTLSISFGAMYPVSIATTVSATAPSLMMSLCIAMSIDYNLFILSRYVEEVRRGRTGDQVVSNVLSTAGHTIIISGITLLVSLLGLLFFPMNMLHSFAYACGFSITIALLISLTFTPALLLTFPRFFENSAHRIQYPKWVPVRLARFLNDEIVITHNDDSGLTPVGSTRTGIVGSPSGGINSGLSAGYGTSDQPAGSPRPRYVPLSSAATFSPNGNPTSKILHSFDERRDKSTPVNNFSISTTQLIRQSSESSDGEGGGPSGFPLAPQQPQPQRFSYSSRTVLLGHVELLPDGTEIVVTTAKDEVERRKHSVFYKLSVILRFPWNVIIFLVGIAIAGGVGVALKDFKTTDSMGGYLPRGTELTKNYFAFAEAFGFGYTYPYRFLFDGQAMPSFQPYLANSEAAFNYSQGLLRYISADPTLAAQLSETTPFMGLPSLGHRWVDYESVRICIDDFLSPDCDGDVLGMLTSSVNADKSAAFVIMFSRVDPLGDSGDSFYKGLLKAMDGYRSWLLSEAVRNAGAAGQVIPTSGDSGCAGCEAAASVNYPNATVANECAAQFDIYLEGVGPSSMDAIDTIYKLFPIIVGASAGAVLVIVGIAFRSILVPIRSVISIAATELFIFGISVLVYRQEPGILDWLGWPNLASEGGISWLTPIVAFSVVVGIALDYDIFLVTRITEFIREDGLSTREAILHGLCSTGSIITAAGLIMALAFFGMILSSIPILNVLGLYLVSAVLFDTFIVRTLIVPTFMSLLGEANWWPRQLRTSDIYRDSTDLLKEDVE